MKHRVPDRWYLPMSGICGSTDDSQRTHVAAMNAAMAARGPGSDRTYTDFLSGVSLGAQGPSIDVKGGKQPLTNEDGTVWAALNGAVYNHPALRQTLGGDGHRFASAVETEVLVHLYEKHGPAMVYGLEGMYTFALWDARQQKLVLVRDRFGEKPLFYAERGGDLLFASQLDALLAGMNREPELDSVSIDAYFVLGYLPESTSIVRGAKQLPPGHVLSWERRSKRVQVERYWAPGTWSAPSGQVDFEELVAETGRLLGRSVRSRLIADVPVGVLMSGGLNSTLIAAIAAAVSDKPIRTFTMGYKPEGASVLEETRRTAQALGTEHQEGVLSDEQVLDRVPALLAGMDQPLADHGLISLHMIAEQACREVSVAICGEGANELFGGHLRHRRLGRSGHVGRTMRAQVSALRGRLYGPALSGGVSQNGLNSRRPLPDHPPVASDQADSRGSLEVRAPYLDRELAEFARAVPARAPAQDGGKALLRAVLARSAPEVVARGTRPAPRVPTAEWLRGPLAPVVDHQLAEGSAFAEGWFDRQEATALVAEHRAGTRDASGAIWPLLAFGLWLDRIRGRDVSADLPVRPAAAR